MIMKVRGREKIRKKSVELGWALETYLETVNSLCPVQRSVVKAHYSQSSDVTLWAGDTDTALQEEKWVDFFIEGIHYKEFKS